MGARLGVRLGRALAGPGLHLLDCPCAPSSGHNLALPATVFEAWLQNRVVQRLTTIAANNTTRNALKSDYTSSPLTQSTERNSTLNIILIVGNKTLA